MTITNPIVEEQMRQFEELLETASQQNPELWTLSSTVQGLSELRLEPQVQEVRIISADSTTLIADE
jgi:hypothetical protein